ncbi:MAG: hypothetical protein AAGK97_18980, partial [Bacteroidota bacterium]
MHLNGLFVIAMKELSKKKKPTAALTIEDFTNVYSEIIKGNVGMHNYFEEKLNEANHKLEEAHDEIKSLKEASKSQGDELIKVKKELVSTKLELERSQQIANRDTFKLCGIKEPTEGGHEDTQDTVIKALETANVSIKREEISAAYRVPGKPEGPKNLLIKCSLQDVKDRVMRNKKILRACEDFKREYPDAFIVEQLTPLRSKVAYMLRQDDNIAKTWTIGGRIKFILAGGGPQEKPKTIDSLSQLKLVPGWDEARIEKLVLD